jgi:hypothetical protein
MSTDECKQTEVPNDEVTTMTELPDEIYQQALVDVIKNNWGTSFDECDVKIEAASGKGDNYIGLLYRAKVTSVEGNELNVIIKLPPTNAARREQFTARPCFLRESLFYDSVYPIFKKFQEDKGFDIKKDGFYQIPKCYMSLTDDLKEGLFLEDLKVTGFEMFDRLKDTTASHVNRVMEALGKLHAISFAIKDQAPELIEEFKTMEDIFLQRDETSREQMKMYFEMIKKQAYDTIKDSDDEDFKQSVQEALKTDFFEIMKNTAEGAVAEPYAVIAHGDCWNNNCMFRYEVRRSFSCFSIFFICFIHRMVNQLKFACWTFKLCDMRHPFVILFTTFSVAPQKI